MAMTAAQTKAYIEQIFKDRGVHLTSGARPGESAQDRLNRILWEVMSGQRTLANVAQSVDRIASVQRQVLGLFTKYGVSLSTGARPGEDPGGRIIRITTEILNGQRTMSQVEAAVKNLAPAVGPKPSSGTGSGPATAPKPGSIVEIDEGIFAYVRGILDSYGLGSLASWARQQLVDGKSDTEILQALRDRPEFKSRFKAIELRQKAGLPALSPAEIIAYEQEAHSIMREAGLPRGFFDNPDDFAQLIGNNVSLNELVDRVNQGYRRVLDLPAEVRQSFEAFFGVGTNSALAALFLDPNKALPVLQRMVTKAEVAGAGAMFGFEIGEGRAGEVAATGVGFEQAQQGFSNIDRIGNIFRENVSEGRDLTAEGEGVDAVFQMGGDGARAIERRFGEREASLAGGGGAAVSGAGLGLGSAD